ncbi:MAG: transposase [Anaerolineae bacterium]|nr:transposase [Anaerolineae bacterium]
MVFSLAPNQIELDTILVRWREHWGIENKLHWIRDAQMGEDASRVRSASISLIKALGFSSIKAAYRHFALDWHRVQID